MAVAGATVSRFSTAFSATVPPTRTHCDPFQTLEAFNELQDLALNAGATAQHTWLNDVNGALMFADNGSGVNRKRSSLLLVPQGDSSVSALAKLYTTFGRDCLLLSKSYEFGSDGDAKSRKRIWTLAYSTQHCTRCCEANKAEVSVLYWRGDGQPITADNADEELPAQDKLELYSAGIEDMLRPLLDNSRVHTLKALQLEFQKITGPTGTVIMISRFPAVPCFAVSEHGNDILAVGVTDGAGKTASSRESKTKREGVKTEQSANGDAEMEHSAVAGTQQPKRQSALPRSVRGQSELRFYSADGETLPVTLSVQRQDIIPRTYKDMFGPANGFKDCSFQVETDADADSPGGKVELRLGFSRDAFERGQRGLFVYVDAGDQVPPKLLFSYYKVGVLADVTSETDGLVGTMVVPSGMVRWEEGEEGGEGRRMREEVDTALASVLEDYSTKGTYRSRAMMCRFKIDEEAEKDLSPGAIVWAASSSQSRLRFWPGEVLNWHNQLAVLNVPSLYRRQRPKLADDSTALVRYLGTEDYAWTKLSELVPFRCSQGRIISALSREQVSRAEQAMLRRAMEEASRRATAEGGRQVQCSDCRAWREAIDDVREGDAEGEWTCACGFIAAGGEARYRCAEGEEEGGRGGKVVKQELVGLEAVTRDGVRVEHVSRGTWHGRPVAVKKFVVPSGSHSAAKRAFSSQLHALLSLRRHPNLLFLRGFWMPADNDNAFGVVTDACGRDLGTAAHADKPADQLDPEAVIQVLLGIADAVTYLHAEGFAHRALKPSNVLLDSRDRPLLCDYGFTWGPDTLLPGTGEPSPYAAPETISPAVEQEGGEDGEVGEETGVEVDWKAADVFSFGAVCVDVLGRVRPTPGEQKKQLQECELLDTCLAPLREVAVQCVSESVTERPRAFDFIHRDVLDVHRAQLTAAGGLVSTDALAKFRQQTGDGESANERTDADAESKMLYRVLDRGDLCLLVRKGASDGLMSECPYSTSTVWEHVCRHVTDDVRTRFVSTTQSFAWAVWCMSGQLHRTACPFPIAVIDTRQLPDSAGIMDWAGVPESGCVGQRLMAARKGHDAKAVTVEGSIPSAAIAGWLQLDLTAKPGSMSARLVDQVNAAVSGKGGKFPTFAEWERRFIEAFPHPTDVTALKEEMRLGSGAEVEQAKLSKALSRGTAVRPNIVKDRELPLCAVKPGIYIGQNGDRDLRLLRARQFSLTVAVGSASTTRVVLDAQRGIIAIPLPGDLTKLKAELVVLLQELTDAVLLTCKDNGRCMIQCDDGRTSLALAVISRMRMHKESLTDAMATMKASCRSLSVRSSQRSLLKQHERELRSVGLQTKSKSLEQVIERIRALECIPEPWRLPKPPVQRAESGERRQTKRSRAEEDSGGEEAEAERGPKKAGRSAEKVTGGTEEEGQNGGTVMGEGEGSERHAAEEVSQEADKEEKEKDADEDEENWLQEEGIVLEDDEFVEGGEEEQDKDRDRGGGQDAPKTPRGEKSKADPKPEAKASADTGKSGDARVERRAVRTEGGRPRPDVREVREWKGGERDKERGARDAGRNAGRDAGEWERDRARERREGARGERERGEWRPGPREGPRDGSREVVRDGPREGVRDGPRDVPREGEKGRPRRSRSRGRDEGAARKRQRDDDGDRRDFRREREAGPNGGDGAAFHGRAGLLPIQSVVVHHHTPAPAMPPPSFPPHPTMPPPSDPPHSEDWHRGRRGERGEPRRGGMDRHW